MAPWKDEENVWDFPTLREIHQIPGHGDFWAVKFYPYTEPGVDPVFAVVGGKYILIGKPPASDSDSAEWIQLVIDHNSESNAGHYACAWSKDLESGTPWLCVTGSSGKIQIINALTGELIKTLIGHGGEILEIVTCPTNPHIIATSSEDTSIRLWNISDAYSKQPCVAILQGEGHRSDVLSIDFHITGNYLLSGGIDRVINLWTIPSDITSPQSPSQISIKTQPLIIHYPHFSTSDISHEIVDCVAFHGDLVFCKSANTNTITLFSITGFSSSSFPLPTPDMAPTAHDTTRTTRSAFVKTPIISIDSVPKQNDELSKEAPQLFTRLLSFDIPDGQILFTRFALSPAKSGTSILAYCNQVSKIFFWDLDRLTAYYDWSSSSPRELTTFQEDPATSTITTNIETPDSDSEPQQRPRFLLPFQRRTRQRAVEPIRLKSSKRATSPTESSESHDATFFPRPNVTSNPNTATNAPYDHDPVTGKNKVDWEKTRENWEKKYEMRDAFLGLEAHKEEMVKGIAFTGRGLGWSVDGEWCVAVGSHGVIALLQKKVVKRSTRQEDGRANEDNE